MPQKSWFMTKKPIIPLTMEQSIIYIFFFDNMEIKISQPTFGNLVDNFLAAVNLKTDQRILVCQLQRTSFRVDQYKSNDSYLQRIGDSIQLSKVRLLEILNQVRKDEGHREATPEEMEAFRQLKQTFKVINSSKKYLLQTGILDIYLSVSELQEQFSQQSSSCLQKLLKLISESIRNLVREYFIYQQYQVQKGSTRLKRSISVSSNRGLKPHQHIDFGSKENLQIFDYDLLNKIQKQLSSKPIHELIEDQTQRQITTFQQTLEKCRICFQEHTLDNIKSHVEHCEKISQLKQEFSSNKHEYDQLKASVLQIYQRLNEKQQKSAEEESLRKVITVFLVEEKGKKQKKVTLFESLKVVNLEQNPSWGWEQYLNKHQEQYGRCEQLSKILKVVRQRKILEKDFAKSENPATVKKSVKFKDQKQGLNCSFSRSNKQSCLTQKTSSYNNVSIEISKNFRRYDEKDEVLSSQSSTDAKSEHLLFDKEKEDWCLLDHLQSFNTKQSVIKPSQESQGSLVDIWSVSLQDIEEPDQPEHVSLDHFQILKVLGKGAYGQVYMVRRRGTDHIYALKIVKMTENSSDKDLQTIENEHQIFKKIGGEHLIKAPFSFSERESHIFVLEFMPGGDLRNLLEREVYLQEDIARFYLAQVVLALEHLHKFQFIHRDLKPENLVIDAEGHLKLTDFGLSSYSLEKRLQESNILKKNSEPKKKNTRRHAVSFQNPLKNLIGTPDYIAPEIINGISTNNQGVDWWSLGVLAYQLIIGTRPFCADTIEEVIQNVLSLNIEWPQVGQQQGMVSNQAKDLIEKLLCKDFTQRLGANGASDIKDHPFFKGVNWSKIKTQKPPFHPNLTQVEEDVIAPEDIKLRQKVEQRIGQSLKGSKKLKLQKFVRYDLLGRETMENVSKIKNQRTDRLKKLKTCRKFELQKSMKSNSDSDVLFQ